MELEQLIFERDLALNSIQRIADCSSNPSEFRVRVKELNSIKKTFFQVQTKIEKLSVKFENFSKEEHLATRNVFDSLYYQVQVTLDTMKETRKQSIASLSPACGLDGHAHCSRSQLAHAHIRLPQLSLQTFDGKLTEWNAFYDLYKSLVHDNESLTNVERFRYLLLFLKDEPYNLIKSIPVTESNYENALQVLINRYENKRIISTKHLDNIFDVEPVNDKNVEPSLRCLLNTYHENITALNSLGFPVSSWSFILLNILLRKITPSIRRRFELSLRSSSEVPPVSELIDFLDKELSASEVMSASARPASAHAAAGRAAAAGTAGGSAGAPAAMTSSRYAQAASRALSFSRSRSDAQYTAPRGYNNYNSPRSTRSMSVHATTAIDLLTKIKCAYCKDNSHPLYKCDNFQKLTLSERKHFINENKICHNCLFVGHDTKDCKSRHSCRVCAQRHHSSLHEDVSLQNVTLTSEYSPSPGLHSVADISSPPSPYGATGLSNKQNCTVLLTTALVNVRRTEHGPYLPRSVRALIDQGSQATLITESCVQRLGLPRYPAQTSTTVTGIGDSNAQPRGYVLCEVTPHNKPEPKLIIEALILPKITSYIPNIPKSFEQIPHLRGLTLADPELRSARPVELLLGSDYSDSILLHDNIKGPQGTPVAINSIFGYLLNGRIPHAIPEQICTNLSTCQLGIQVQRFGELESAPNATLLYKDDLRYESIFVETHKRELNGKYTVSLPFKENAPPLGDSRAVSLSRLNKPAVGLLRNPALRANYNRCLKRYRDLEHIEPVSASGNSDTLPYYIPHDNLLMGQKLQQAIMEVSSKLYNNITVIVFTEYIKMIYLFIDLCKEHRDFQRILWRFSPLKPVQEFSLCTVTSGVASAPFLAPQTHCQLAIDETASFPRASQVLLNEVFVDDRFRSSPHKWRTNVSHRIPKTSNVPALQWHHVPSADNPTDLALRDVLQSQLNYQQWINGSSWLTKPQSQKLKSFLDTKLLRVGGRINCTNVPYDAKPQILLPKKHYFTYLLIDCYYKANIHVSPQTFQYALGQTYWVLSACDEVRMRTHRCVPCDRARSVAPQPVMAPLPALRVRSLRPFLRVGLAFAGHLYLKSGRFRNAKIYKSFVCVFVCMSMKAIHLVLVSDLATESLLNASLHVICTDIFSDCGRNFVGCARYLTKLNTFLRDESNQSFITKKLTDLSITWHFNPPYASHFGGNFEAAVKSMKTHLYRVIGKLSLTHDKFDTLLCQIEAILNSRPLCTLSNDPGDPLPLTPGHFLIGKTLTAIPDFNFNDNPNRLVRWQVIQPAVQYFWRRWTVEYLHQLQPRGKWFHDTNNISLSAGSVVVLVDNTLPPLQWRLARVHQLHPGADDVTRVVTVRIGNTLTKRPVVKVCPLPVQ